MKYLGVHVTLVGYVAASFHKNWFATCVLTLCIYKTLCFHKLLSQAVATEQRPSALHQRIGRISTAAHKYA